jgi:hypothetical protein
MRIGLNPDSNPYVNQDLDQWSQSNADLDLDCGQALPSQKVIFDMKNYFM